MRKGQKNKIGDPGHGFRWIVRIHEIGATRQGGVNLTDRFSRKSPRGRRYNLHLRVGKQQSDQFLSRITAPPVDTDSDHFIFPLKSA